MSILALFILAIVLILPVAWLVSEVKEKRKAVRCTLGVLSIFSCFGVAIVAAQIVRLDYNIWYSSATAKLLDSTITELEQGHTGDVVERLKTLRKQMHVTYEHKGNYDELVRDCIKK